MHAPRGSCHYDQISAIKNIYVFFMNVVGFLHFSWLIRCSCSGSDLNSDVWNVSVTGNRPKNTATQPDKTSTRVLMLWVSGGLHQWYSWIFLARMWNRNPGLGRREEGWQENALTMDDVLYHLCLEVFKSLILTSTSDIMIFKK